MALSGINQFLGTTRSFTFPPLFVQWGKKSTLCALSPLCRDMLVVIKFTNSRKLLRHCF